MTCSCDGHILAQSRTLTSSGPFQSVSPLPILKGRFFNNNCPQYWGLQLINKNKKVIPVVILTYEMLIVPSSCVPKMLLGSMLLWSCWPTTFTSQILRRYLMVTNRRIRQARKYPYKILIKSQMGSYSTDICTQVLLPSNVHMLLISTVKNVCIHGYKRIPP